MSIGRKPENGYEIQNVACSRNGVMTRLFFVNYELCSGMQEKENAQGLARGTPVLKYICLLG